MPKRVLIIGASSGIGRAAVDIGLEKGYAVRGFARSAGDINMTHEHFEAHPGDALVASDIEAALDNVDAVIQVLGVSANLKMLTGPVDLFSKATEILVPAMETANVRRLIAVTGYGAGDGRDKISPLQRIGFEVFLGRTYDDKDKQEEIIRASSLDWTIVRPGVLTTSEASGDTRVLVEPDTWRNGFVSRRRVARFLIEQVDATDLIGKTPVVIGPNQLPNI